MYIWIYDIASRAYSLLCCAQTGAGKTYTMCGDLRVYELRGLIPRTLSVLFETLEKHPETEFTISVSYCEIYSDLMFDLLAEGGLEGQTGTELQVSPHGFGDWD